MIIGIIGRARSGKDTLAEIMAEELYNKTKRRFILMAYAHELKMKVQEDFDLRYEQLWGEEKEVVDKRYEKDNGNFWTGREILQEYGEFFRSIDTDFWINRLFKIIDNFEYKNIIVTDIRHNDEAEAIINREGYIIRITSERNNIEEINGKEHISETAMDAYDKVDFSIKNDGTLADLRKTVVDMITFLVSSKK